MKEKPNRRRPISVTVMLTADEFLILASVAEQLGWSRATLLRTALIEFGRRHRSIVY